MNWKKAKVLVTGASGFIGSHLTEHLINLGAKITVLLEYNPNNYLGHLKFLQKNMLSEMEQILGDIRDPELIKKIVKGKDTIFHLGALVSIPYSFINPREVFEVNALGTLNILLAARDQEINKIVTTSTSEVYGTALYTPIDENHPLQAQSPYAASKIAADKIAESFYKTYNLPVAIIRPFNTYGPRQSDRAIIPTIIIQALKKSTINIGSTTPRRDLSYISDTVDGFIKIAESKKSIGQVINIGLGKDISIGELIKKIILIITILINIKYDGGKVKAVIMAGGKGTRLKPITFSIPKPLLPVGEKPILELIISRLCSLKINDITIAIGYGAELIKAYFGDGKKFNIKINYVHEKKSLGTAGPLKMVKNLKEPFLVMNGDIITKLNFLDLFSYHKKNNAAMTIAVKKYTNQLPFGTISFNKNNVIDIEEKPTTNHLISTGIYILSPMAIRFIPVNIFFTIPDLVKALIKEKLNVIKYEFDEYWLQLNNWSN